MAKWAGHLAPKQSIEAGGARIEFMDGVGTTFSVVQTTVETKGVSLTTIVYRKSRHPI